MRRCISPSADDSDGTVRLSAAEREVLQLSAAGLVTAEVTAHLGVTPDEVRRHLQAAMTALGSRSKLEGVVLALRLGLIDVRDADG